MRAHPLGYSFTLEQIDRGRGRYERGYREAYFVCHWAFEVSRDEKLYLEGLKRQKAFRTRTKGVK
jgi:hypothetical protein